ncbi:MAG: site-specific integrase, partial [Ruminococcus sp.]|nr:site-specific integrase [Ruminococcus sp.]
KDVSCFQIEHLEKLFDDDSKYCRMFQFDLWTGLRRGELLALHWNNIHVPEKYITVCQTLVRTADGDVIISTTKSRCDRVVPLHDKAVSLLGQIKALDSADGFLFCNPDGTPLKLRQYNRIYCKYYVHQHEKYPDLPYYTPHNLRHSYATYMLQSGADIETLRALLGHVDITTTQRYVHSNLNQMYKATDNLKFGNL